MILIIAISDNSGSADCGMQNGQSPQYSALAPQSRPACRAAKSARLWGQASSQAQTAGESLRLGVELSRDACRDGVERRFNSIDTAVAMM
jgi:hypothetical protein